MKRKVLITAISVMLLLCFATSGALAATNAEIRQLYRKIDTANTQIKIYTLWAMITPYDDVDWLLGRVQATVRPVFAYADAIGATIACEYDYYWIDGQWVAVDPLRVINVGTPSGGTTN